VTAPTSPRSHGRFLRVVVVASASVALVLGLVVGVTAVRWVQLADVNTDETFVPLGPQADGTDAPVEPESPGGCADRPCNYLLLGSDSRAALSEEEQQAFGTNEDIGGEARADTVMLVHTDPDLQKAIILSFPRDLWVQIPGVGWGKINSAFEGGIKGGGPSHMAQTVANLTGLRIDHYLYVDLAGFQDIVDTLGGVEMCPPAYLADPATGRITDPLTGLDIEPGCQRFGGATALGFVRSRHLRCDFIPDFSRIGRQQQFLRAVINQMVAPQQIAKAPALVEPVLRNMRRDKGLRPAELVYLVGQLRGITTGAAEFRAVPGTPGWAGELSVVRMDPSAAKIFAAIREGRPIADVGLQLVSTPPSEANIAVAVIDAASSGAASEAEALLSGAGFDVSPGVWPGSRTPKGVTGAAIVFAPGQDAKAQVVLRYFPGLKILESSKLQGADVALVIPAGWTPKPPVDGGIAAECPDPAA
jgi:LCP family protein required for cell wall assembly